MLEHDAHERIMTTPNLSLQGKGLEVGWNG